MPSRSYTILDFFFVLISPSNTWTATFINNLSHIKLLQGFDHRIIIFFIRTNQQGHIICKMWAHQRIKQKVLDPSRFIITDSFEKKNFCLFFMLG